jgi:hypothetical protein
MMPFRRLRIFLVIPIVILMSGCAVKFIYNQLDWLIPWYLDDYVSLTAEQENMLDQRLEEYLSWHRQKQLAVYADFLDEIALASEDGFSLTELDEIQFRTEIFGDQLFARLAPAMVDLFVSLDDEQVDELFVNFEQENEKYYKKFVEREEQFQRAKRFNDMRKFIQRWTGELNEKQIERIERWSEQYQLMGEDFLLARKVWQQHLKEILNRRIEREFFEQSLINLFANRRLGRSSEYDKKLKYNKLLLEKLELDLDQSLYTQQRSHMIRTLNNYAQDFRELSEQK